MELLRDDERELATRLEAYARLRLRPDPVAMARMRSALVADARRRTGPVPIHARLRDRLTRRMTAGLLAAAATLIVAVGSVAASQAGGPLYGARLWVESAALPSDAAPRAVAQMTRLEARLAEVRAALDAGDAGAAAAAGDAYQSILEEMLAGPVPDAGTLQRLEAAISKHLGILESLLATAPPRALDALRHAIDRSDNGLRELERRAAGGEPGSRPSTPPGQASTPPGQASTPPRQASTPPGQASPAPPQASPRPSPQGQPSTPPGQASPRPSPQGQPSTPPGQASPKPDGTKQGVAKP